MVLFHSLLNVGILALLLFFAFEYQTVRNNERADARHTLAHYLFASSDRTHSFLHRKIETIDEFAGSIEHAVQAYYAVPARSRGLFMHYTDTNTSRNPRGGAIAPPELLLQYHEGFNGSPTYAQVATETYPLTLEYPLGPFAHARALLRNSSESCTPQVDVIAGGAFIPCRVSAIGDFLDRVVQLRLSFSLFSRGRRWSGGGARATIPSTWDVVVDYGFEGHKAVMTMAVRLSCVSRRHVERGPLLVCWLLGLATLADLYWRVSTHVKDTAVKRGKHHGQREERTRMTTVLRLEKLDTSDVKENGWRWLGYLSNVVVLAFTTAAIVAQHRDRTSDALEEAVTLLLAFAAMLSSFRVVVLLKLFPSWYVLIDGLATALQQLSVLAVGVLPVLLGYAVCGTAVFGGVSSSTYFQSIPDAMVTLLCATFGDNLLDVFLRMDQSPYWLQMFFARLFIITFLALFVCNILNIAHSIIQDSYSQALKSYASLLAAKDASRAADAALISTAAGTNAETTTREDHTAAKEGMDSDDHHENGSNRQAKPCGAGGVAATRATGSSSAASSAAASHSSGPCAECGRAVLLEDHGQLRAHGTLRASEVERILRRLDQVSLA